MKKGLQIIVYFLLFCLLVFSIVIIWPKKYNVPAWEERPGTSYWDLPSGSRIAYTFFPAKGIKKPFPVIFLQGGPGGAVYDRNIKSLAPLCEEGYDVYFYDQVGCGFSERLKNIEEYTVERHTNDLAEIVKTIGSGKVILIGQSWGAMLATQFVADNPDKVEKIILTSPGPFLPINQNLGNITPPDSLKLREPLTTNRKEREKVYSMKTRFVEFCARKFNLKLAPDQEMDDFASYLNFKMGKSTVCDTAYVGPIENGSGFYSMVKTVQSFGTVTDKRKNLLTCKVPILIMKGQCDHIKWGYTSEYLSLFADHQLVIIQDAGHGIALEQPEIYLKTISLFLDR